MAQSAARASLSSVSSAVPSLRGSIVSPELKAILEVAAEFALEEHLDLGAFLHLCAAAHARSSCESLTSFDVSITAATREWDA